MEDRFDFETEANLALNEMFLLTNQWNSYMFSFPHPALRNQRQLY